MKLGPWVLPARELDPVVQRMRSHPEDKLNELQAQLMSGAFACLTDPLLTLLLMDRPGDWWVRVAWQCARNVLGEIRDRVRNEDYLGEAYAQATYAYEQAWITHNNPDWPAREIARAAINCTRSVMNLEGLDYPPKYREWIAIVDRHIP